MEPPPDVLRVADPAALATTAAAWIADRIAASVAEHGRCSVALAGGSTPRAVYAALGRAPLAGRIAWASLDLYFGDERCVPPDHADSNHAMALAAFTEGGGARPLRLHRIEAERADRDGAARDYAARLPDPLDLVILGIGEDGHVASLFPGSPALDERVRRVVATEGAKAPVHRITITPPVLARAGALVVLAAGAGKALAVKSALEGWQGDVKRVPACLARGATWIVDRAAAAALDGAR